MAERINFEDKWELVGLMGEKGGLGDRRRRGSRLLIRWGWRGLIRRPIKEVSSVFV
jgi:hypothetical protein